MSATIRLYRSHAQVLLTLLLYAKQRGEGITAIHTYLKERVGKDHREAFSVASDGNPYAANGRYYTGPHESIEELIEFVTEQLQSNVEDEGDMIDWISSVIGTPYAGNVMSGPDVVKGLRKALFLPSELAALRESLGHERFCECGYAFQSGDMATVQIYESREAQVFAVTCPLCYTPITVPCTRQGEDPNETCKARVELPTKVRDLIRKASNCGEHDKKKAPPTPTPEPQVVPTPEPIVARNERMDQLLAAMNRFPPTPTQEENGQRLFFTNPFTNPTPQPDTTGPTFTWGTIGAGATAAPGQFHTAMWVDEGIPTLTLAGDDDGEDLVDADDEGDN